ncbi:restriction endonuclease subunit S [Vibrio campbellii]|uniref:restriction endonuclease subunit S n=1 Tax=Vibrio campbellii TaxID=680 RepID=UPI003857E0AD
MSNLPKGWRATLLNEVVDKIVGGGTPSKSVPSYYEGDIPWMTVKDMNKSYLTDTIDHITQEAIDNSSTNVIPAGTPIIATRMSLGKIVRASFDSAINQDLKALFVNREVDDYYFEYWYRSQGLKIESLGTGTTVKGVRLEVINALEFPLAPLAEQKRIVEKLDEVLAQVDTIKARLDGIPDLLKRFRQSVLASAVSGKLTEEWRGEEERILGEGSNLPQSWQVKAANEVCSKVQSGSTPRNDPFNQDGKVPFLKVYNIVNQKIDFDYKPQFVTTDTHQDKLKRSIAYPGDVLMNIVGPPLGKVAILTDQYPEWNLNQAITLFRANDELLINKYLYFVLCEGALVRDVMPETKGSVGQVNISLTQCRESKVPLPPLGEQKEIVRLVDQYFAFADTIEAQVKKAQARVDNLTQSILAKAFRGELVDQDPNDEPADKLLERIAEARKEAEALAKAAKKAEAAKKRAAKSA